MTILANIALAGEHIFQVCGQYSWVLPQFLQVLSQYFWVLSRWIHPKFPIVEWRITMYFHFFLHLHCIKTAEQASYQVKYLSRLLQFAKKGSRAIFCIPGKPDFCITKLDFGPSLIREIENSAWFCIFQVCDPSLKRTVCTFFVAIFKKANVQILPTTSSIKSFQR